MTNPRRTLIGLAAVAIGVGTLLAVINGQHNIHRGAYAALALGIGWGFIGTGLYTWTRRPASNIGPLMTAVGFAGLLKALAFSNDSVIFAIGSLGELLIYALLIHLLLSFPSGRLDSRLDRVLVAIAYFNTTVVQLAAFVLNDPQQGCAHCPANPLLIDHADTAAGVISAAQLAIVHDAELAEERDLVRAVGATAALTLENERLDAELRANVDELRVSLARIVTAGYAERRRLEPDLHDGAQQRADGTRHQPPPGARPGRRRRGDGRAARRVSRRAERSDA